MVKEWKGELDLTTVLKEFSLKLDAWNMDTLVNISQRKKRYLMRLERVQRSLERLVKEAHLELEMKLKAERNELLLQEEILWLQMLRIDWLKYEDRKKNSYFNTKLKEAKQSRISIE